ncbi:MAG: tRNA lysidine(34) synthetase TilS [Oscillospiraceae bacterium]|jgi:tRNA(Ile)-lysidine synthase|nr:tRNA lysidine(34) synthetase TilS [Oscillospiraceae bacterium]
MLSAITGFADKYDMLPRGATIIAAVSGGADSTALLAALCELAPARDLIIHAAHFDHRLRGEESDRDREFVLRLCKRLGVSCHVGYGDTRALASSRGGGLEDAARELRYEFFAELSGGAQFGGRARVAVAHTADDNAETMLFNLARGSGTRGLAGIPPVRGNIIRPMLSVTRADVNAFLSERGLEHAEDSTNADEAYSRNAIRHKAVPVLREINPRFAPHALRAAELLREDDEYLTALALDFIAARCDNGIASTTELLSLPRPVASRVVMALSGGRLRSAHIDAIFSLCRASSGTARLSIPGGDVTRLYDRLVFGGAEAASSLPTLFPEYENPVDAPAPRLRISLRDAVAATDAKAFYKASEKINKRFTVFMFKKSEVCGRIVVRPRAAGDSIKILGGKITKSLKKLFIEKKIPASRRELIPIIADALGPLAVYGVAVGARAAFSADDDVIELRFEEYRDETADRSSN